MNNRPTALPVNTLSIPEDLKALPRWVLWRYTKKKKPNGEFVWSKIPFTCANAYASSTNSATWCTFDEAADALLMGDFDGLGIVLGGDLHGIDLDDCRDPKTGTLNDFAKEVVERVHGYAEVSPSGTGLKIFCNTNLDGSRTKKEVGVELYKDGRYFTVTGRVLNGRAGYSHGVQDLNWLVEKVWDEHLGAAPSDDDGSFLMTMKSALEGWDLDRVVDEVLVHLDPDGGYEEWLKVGAALHHQGGGDHEWLDAWDNWSAGSSKWVDGYCAEKWASFSQQRANGRGAVTLASMLHITKDAREGAKTDKREAAMQLMMEAIDKCTDAHQLQEKIAAQVAHTAEISDIEREQIAVAIQSKIKDLGTKLPMATIRGWVRARVKATGGFVHFNDDGYPTCTLPNFRALIDKVDYSVRYNVIKKAIELLIPNTSFTRDNRDNAAISHVLSQCEIVRMPTKHVAQFLITLADENQYNPVATWIDSTPWDGVSRLDEFYATVKVAHGEEIKRKLMRKWLIQAVAAAFSPDGIANQGILTFVGPQNIGKTTWFQRLAPHELDAILTGHTLDMRSKDSIFIALSYWIVELGELDATFSKSEISALKSFTTQSMDKLRRPYAMSESNFGRRTVFGGTVNEPLYLNDPTGNRRFWSIEVEGFDLSHKIDMQQLWAEVLTIWQGGELWNLSKDEVEELSKHNEEFTVTDPIEERIAAGFDWSLLGLSGESWVAATDVLMKFGGREPSKGQTIAAGRALRRLNGGQRRKSNGRALFLVPVEESEFLG